MKKQIITSLILITLVVIARLLPHPPNVTPLAAVALFSGVYLRKKLALTLPLIALFASDLFLGAHNTMIYVYASVAAVSLMGLFLSKKKTFAKITTSTLFASILFYLVTNFGVWAQGGLYPQTVDGLLQSYYQAIPFFRNSLAGNVFYTALLFGGYELVVAKSKSREKLKHFFTFNNSQPN